MFRQSDFLLVYTENKNVETDKRQTWTGQLKIFALGILSSITLPCYFCYICQHQQFMESIGLTCLKAQLSVSSSHHANSAWFCLPPLSCHVHPSPLVDDWVDMSFGQ